MKNLLKLIFLLLISENCFSDFYIPPNEHRETSYKFKDTEIIKIYDGTKSPEYRVKVLYKGVEQTNIKNLTFDEIRSFYDERYFLAVSNSGISQMAYFILRADGSLIKAVEHSDKFKYCQSSITILRRWVDTENMEIYLDFKKVNHRGKTLDWLTKVYVKACDGSKYEVWSI
jgi:hypothetical protein